MLVANLYEARTKAGLTQQALADLAGVSKKYIGRIENAYVSVDMLSTLSKSVGNHPIPAPSERPERLEAQAFLTN